jgi:hypothetical protein
MRTAVIKVRGALVDFAKPTTEVSFELPLGLRDLVQSQGVPHVEVAAVTVDGREVPWSHRIRGDEHIVVEPRYPLPKSLSDSRFALDGHLGTLARDLRLLGFDSWYQRTVDDADLVSISVESGRMLLSRDLGLLMRSALATASYVRATDPDEQIVEVLARFGLGEKVQPFRRCLACNALLVSASASQVAANVDPRIAAQFYSFRHCTDCGRTYWEGSHYERLAARVETILRSAPIRAAGERPRPADPRSRPAG